MGLTETILAGLAALCLNSTCTDDVSERRSIYFYQRQALKEELRNENIRITTLINGPLSGYKIENGTAIGTGVAFDIIHILQKEYGFNYTFVVPENNVFNPLKSRKGGVKDMLINNKVDVVAAFLPIVYSDVVGYSRNLDTAQWVVLMKRPKESATGSGLLAPFTATVWTLIIISLLGVGPILYLIVFLRARMCKDDNDTIFSLPDCMWFVYGALLKQGSTLNPSRDSARLLFSTWWIFITILTAFYTANLTAFLTLSKFTLPISKPEDIVKKHYEWVTNKGNGIIEQLFKSKTSSNSDLQSLYEEIGEPIKQIDAEDTLILNNYVKQRNYMYIREKTVLETIMYDDYKYKTKANIEETKRCTYVITTFPVCTFPRSFAFTKNFKYASLFDLTIQHLSESGITRFKQREFLPDTTICPLDLGNKERRLRNSDLAMTYMIVGAGLITSIVIFAIEVILRYAKIHKCCTKRPLVVIDKNNVALNHCQLSISNKYSNNYNSNIHYTFGSSKFGSPNQFVTPPPAYHMLFNQLPGLPERYLKKKTINGREYWVTNNKNGTSWFIPQRAPSALLYQFTN